MSRRILDCSFLTFAFLVFSFSSRAQAVPRFLQAFQACFRAVMEQVSGEKVDTESDWDTQDEEYLDLLKRLDARTDAFLSKKEDPSYLRQGFLLRHLRKAIASWAMRHLFIQSDRRFYLDLIYLEFGIATDGTPLLFAFSGDPTAVKGWSRVLFVLEPESKTTLALAPQPGLALPSANTAPTPTALAVLAARHPEKALAPVPNPKRFRITHWRVPTHHGRTYLGNGLEITCADPDTTTNAKNHALVVPPADAIEDVLRRAGASQTKIEMVQRYPEKVRGLLTSAGLAADYQYTLTWLLEVEAFQIRSRKTGDTFYLLVKNRMAFPHFYLVGDLSKWLSESHRARKARPPYESFNIYYKPSHYFGRSHVKPFFAEGEFDHERQGDEFDVAGGGTFFRNSFGRPQFDEDPPEQEPADYLDGLLFVVPGSKPSLPPSQNPPSLRN